MSNIFGYEFRDTPLTLELDADSLVYRIGGAVDMLGEGRQFCERLIDQTITNIYEETNCNTCNIYLGGEGNYRNKIATLKGYKANRNHKDRPKYYGAIRAHLVREYNAILVAGQEAEDAVGIAAYRYDNFNEFMIGAIDKDMKMIVGTHFNYVTNKIEFIDKRQALCNFYTQLVTGDMTDNIPGAYHLLLHDGKEQEAHEFRYSRYKKALTGLLENATTELEMYSLALSFYTQYYDNDEKLQERILEIGRLLWIRREPYELWVPPTQRDFDYLDLDSREVQV